MIIDSHIHIGKTHTTQVCITFEELIELLLEYKIFKAVVMPNVKSGASSIEASQKFINKYNELSNFEKEFYIPYAWIDVNEDYNVGNNWVDIHESYIEFLKENSFKGIKVHTSISQLAITDKKYEPLIDYCTKQKIPILCHCGRHPISHISSMIEISERHRNCNFIAAHMGGNAYDLVDEAIELLGKTNMNNLFIDTSTGRHPNLLRKFLDRFGNERLLFGTDLPYTNMELNFLYFKLAGLDDIEYRNIMGYNYYKYIIGGK